MYARLLVLWCFSLTLSVESRQIHHFDGLKLLNTSQRHIFIQSDGLASINHKVQLGIVNGKAASRGQFCYAVYLQFTDAAQSSIWSCTGSLVSEKVILTAAHCVDGAFRGAAVLGALDLKQPYEPGRQIVRFSSGAMKKHEEYDDYMAYNDIAIITLSEPVYLSKYVCTVNISDCAASTSNKVRQFYSTWLGKDVTVRPVTKSDNYTVAGWGKTSDSQQTTKLMYAEVAGEDHSSCYDYYSRHVNYRLRDNQICTSGAAGKSTCNGDSGGPLVQNGIQKGIVSLGTNSCERGAPSVYTYLDYFTSWLCQNIGKK